MISHCDVEELQIRVDGNQPDEKEPLRDPKSAYVHRVKVWKIHREPQMMQDIVHI